jgi:catechol 2,3-dioxygenase-like lactoylglutathione lyase family enzyme
MRLGQAIIFADDVEKMAAFYSGLLGLTLKDGSVAEGFVRFADASGGAVVALHKIRGGGSPPASPEPRNEGCIKLCFTLEDRAAVERERTRLSEAGITMRKLHDWEGVTFCDGEDPEGNVFQLTTRY